MTYLIDYLIVYSFISLWHFYSAIILTFPFMFLEWLRSLIKKKPGVKASNTDWYLMSEAAPEVAQWFRASCQIAPRESRVKFHIKVIMYSGSLPHTQKKDLF